MSPMSLSHVIDQIVRDKARRMALEDQQRGRASDIPHSLYVEQIAELLGITKRQLYRYMDGSTSPASSTLLQLCLICESSLPLKWLDREYRAIVRTQGGDVNRNDVIGLVSHEMEEAARSAREVLLAIEDGQVTPDALEELSKMLDHASDAMMDVKVALQAIAKSGTPAPIPFDRSRAARRA